MSGITQAMEYNAIIFKIDNIPHRPNGPAIQWLDGDWAWAHYGQAHRYYGPALSRTGWWLRDQHIKR